MSVEAKLEILLEAVDQASAIFKTASDNIQGAMGQVTTAQENVAKSTKAADVSTTDMLLATNNLASGCSRLVFTFESVERAQFAVEKAHLAVNRATDNAEQSQDAYNEAVSKYGVDSDQAKQAADKLAIAQEALTVAQDRAGIVQNNLTQAMVSAALNVIPTLMSVVTSATTVISNLTGVTLTASMAMNAIPFVAVAAGAIAIGVAVYSWVSASNAAAESQKELDRLLGVHEELMNRSIVTWDELSSAIEANKENLSKLQAKYDEVSAKEDAQVKMANDLITMFGGLGLTTDQLTQGIVKLTSSYEENKKILSESMTEGEKQQIQWQESQSIAELYFSTVTEKSAAFQKSVSDLADTFKTDFATMTMAQVADSEVMKLDIQALADQYGVSWDQVETAVSTAVETSIANMDKLTTNLKMEWGKQEAAASISLGAISFAFEDAFNEGRFKDAADMVVAFANQHGISFSDAEKILEEFAVKQQESMDKANQAVADFTSGLENKFNMQLASASETLPEIAALYDSAFSEKRFDDCRKLVWKFAEDFGINTTQVVKLIDELNEKMDEVPLTMEQKLVEEAQEKFEAFKNCISGKALTTSTDVVGTMASMADSVTDLINKGFVGEAQAEMAAYVNCSTNKVADMVQMISGPGGYIDDLTKQHNDKVKTLSEAAEKAYGSEKDVILAMLDAENAGFKTKMGTFAVWLSELYAQLLTQADSTLSRVDTIVGGALAAIAKLHLDLAGAGTIIEDVWAKGEGKAITRLAKGLTGTTPSPAESDGTSSTAATSGAPAAVSGGTFEWVPSVGTFKSSTGMYIPPAEWEAHGLAAPTAEGGIFTRPTVRLIGEAGPEAVVPLRQLAPTNGPTVIINISDSLIDRPMVDLIKKEVFKALESVTVEPTSSGAPATSRRIRS